MKTVGNNSFVAHQWASGKNKMARNGNRSFSTEENIIYSYNTAIGAVYPDVFGNGNHLYVVNTTNYSMTTSSKHQPELRSAIPRLYGTNEYVTSKRFIELPRTEQERELQYESRTEYLFKNHKSIRRHILYTERIRTSLEAQIVFDNQRLLSSLEEKWQAVKTANKRNQLRKFSEWIAAYNTYVAFYEQVCKAAKVGAIPAPKLPKGENLESLYDRYQVYLRNWRESENRSIENKEKREELQRQKNFAAIVDKAKTFAGIKIPEMIILAKTESVDTASLESHLETFKGLNLENRENISETHKWVNQADSLIRSLDRDIKTSFWNRTGLEGAKENLRTALEAWKRGEITNHQLECAKLPEGKPHNVFFDWKEIAGHSDLLRIKPNCNGSIVQTNRSAEVPLEAVQKAIRFVQTLWNSGKTYKHENHSFHIGSFVLREITESSVTVGCHTFSRQVIEDFAASIAAI